VFGELYSDLTWSGRPFSGPFEQKVQRSKTGAIPCPPHAGPLPAWLLGRFPVQTSLYGVVHGVQDEPDQEEYPRPQEDL
jgi:hypothetical protein